MTATAASDTSDRENIARDLDRSYIVEAAAGTGKTTALVGRIVNVVRFAKATMDQIVAVTFTEKAAGELKLRLREELERTRGGAAGDERLRLGDALEHLEEARVSTIHGFCADLLRERPVEACIDPQFQVLTEDRALAIYGVAFDMWLQEQLADPGEGVRRSLRRPARRAYGSEEDEDGPVARLRRAGWSLATWRDHDAAWRRDPFERESDLDRLVAQLRAFTALSAQPGWEKDPLYLDLGEAHRRCASIENGEVPADDYDGLEASLIDLRHNRGFARPRKGSGAAYSRGRTRASVWDARQALFDALGEFEQRANADLAAHLRDDLQGSLDRYEALKAGEGALDFVDLLLKARTLLRDSAAVRRTFRERVTHLFVDEFQDTDPLQAEILVLLSGAPDRDVAESVSWRDVIPRPGSLFIVGDPKQSIYRFRRADVGTYRDVCGWLEERGAQRAWLTTSFRSTPQIQRAVNAAFAPLMTDDAATMQPTYVPLSPSRSDRAQQPAVVVLPVPRPYGVRNVTKKAIEESLPDAVGAFLGWLLNDSHWKVSERNQSTGAWADVNIQARHVCLLFRRFTSFGDDMTREYVEALEARDIPHLLVGGKSFHNREEVETVRAALNAVEWPDDELSVFATLRGALFAIGDELLLEYHHHFRHFNPYQVPEHLTARLAPIGEALSLVRELHQRRNSRPVADTLSDLLIATRAHVGVALRRGGEQALANVLHIADLARRYEADGGISFRGFVEELGNSASHAEAPEAPILEEGSDGVRLMTVHKAKGLEFPVVLLVDMSCRLSRETADRYIDGVRGLCAQRLAGWAPVELLEQEPLEVERDRREGHRLAYVAATRARDLLVIPAIGDEPYREGWTGPLDGAIFPPFERRREAQAHPECPSFRKDTVLERPGGDPARADTVHPGLHRMSGIAGEPDGSYDIVWWDPGVLMLERPSTFGVRHEELIARDALRSVVDETLAVYRTWETDRAVTVERAARASLAVQTATEWAGIDLPMTVDVFDGQVSIHSVSAGDRLRPSGARFGALVHAVLGAVSLEAVDDQIREMAIVQARLLAATPDETVAASEVVTRALAHPLFVKARQAAASGQCRREVPVTYTAPDGMIIEGVVDLAFENKGRWTVVDLKTDIEIGRLGLDRYKRQVALYAAAIARATSKPVEAALLRV